MNHADDLLFSGDGNFTVGVQGTFDNKGNKCDANKDSRLADYKWEDNLIYPSSL